MLSRLKAARLLWPFFSTLAVVLLTLGLGFWQLERLTWKEGLIAAITDRTNAPPMPLAEALARWQSGERPEYLRVEAAGRFVHDRELYLYAPSATEGPGFHVYTPMVIFAAGVTDGVPQTMTLIVNRGFVPAAYKDPAARKEGLVNETPVFEIPGSQYHQEGIKGEKVVGLLRSPEQHSTFAPDNDVKANQWYWRDLDGMMQALGPKLGGGSRYPFFLDLEDRPVPGGWPRGGVTLVKLPNRHLEYAITWFGLAAASAAVFLAYAVQRLKSTDDRAGS